MLNRLGKKFKILRRGDRGSSIIVVLVTMTFVIVLASVLLYLSLVNMQMKKLEKGSKANFYNAESVMSEIRAGLQGAVSDAIKTAYSKVLVSYNTVDETTQKKNFTKGFYENLFAETAMNAADNTKKVIFNATGTTYDASALMNYVSNRAGVTVTGTQTVQQATDGGVLPESITSITLKTVVVKAIAGGYQTTVSSDIVITTPPLLYTKSKITQTPMPDYAIIAKGSLKQPAGAGKIGIIGSTRAGGLTVAGTGNELNVLNADSFVLADSVNVAGGRLTFNTNSQLWAKNIKLDMAGSISIAGDAYIANDLNLYGSETQATLSGRYFGFGDSKSVPGASSAILINGRETKLDMSALRSLMLAGRSFVDYEAGANSTVLTGESISVKSNQLAYLIPDSCLTNGMTNPLTYKDTPPVNPQNNVNFSQPSLNGGKKLSDYGISSAAGVQLIYKSVGETHLIYFCMKFPTTDAANAYFKDYFTASKTSVQKYLDLYTNGILLNSNATENLSGQGMTYDGTSLGLIAPYGVPGASTSELATSYSNLCVTLTRTVSGGGAATAYDYFVDAAQMAALSGTKYYPPSGAPKVAVIKGDYTIDTGTDSNIHLVIASGKVTVNRDFTGLIIAGDEVTLNKTVTASTALVQEALQALSNDDDHDSVYVYYYLNPQHVSPLNITSTSSSDKWDLSALVAYQNWAKNEV